MTLWNVFKSTDCYECSVDRQLIGTFNDKDLATFLNGWKPEEVSPDFIVCKIDRPDEIPVLVRVCHVSIGFNGDDARTWGEGFEIEESDTESPATLHCSVYGDRIEFRAKYKCSGPREAIERIQKEAAIWAERCGVHRDAFGHSIARQMEFEWVEGHAGPVRNDGSRQVIANLEWIAPDGLPRKKPIVGRAMPHQVRIKADA